MLFAGVFFFGSCENEIEKVKLLTSSENLPSEISKDIIVTYSDSAKTKMILKAPLLERYPGDEPYTEFREGVEITFFNKQGEQESKLNSNYAINYDKDKRMVAKGDVVVINSFGDKLNSEYLVWKEKEKRITSDVFVKITTKDEIIYGDGLDANEDFSQYKIKNIKGIINIKDEEPKAK